MPRKDKKRPFRPVPDDTILWDVFDTMLDDGFGPARKDVARALHAFAKREMTPNGIPPKSVEYVPHVLKPRKHRGKEEVLFKEFGELADAITDFDKKYLSLKRNRSIMSTAPWLRPTIS